jgi:hypothetical protein
MKPIEFKEQNIIFAKNQKEYLPLPAFVKVDGDVISCWRLSFKERFKILFTGKLWLCVKTFNTKLQPLLPTVDKKQLI